MILLADCCKDTTAQGIEQEGNFECLSPKERETALSARFSLLFVILGRYRPPFLHVPFTIHRGLAHLLSWPCSDVHCPTEQVNDTQHPVNASLYCSCLWSELGNQAVTLENKISSINSSSLGPYSETTCFRAAKEIIPTLLRLAFGNLVSRMFAGKWYISRPSQSD